MSSENPTLSLCMIVKNEAENLPQCLEPVKDVFDQIVIVDTGSEDNTVEIAKSYGAEVHHFKWIDDFSAARNESLKHATGDYIFFLDGDDRMEYADALKLRELITPKKDVAYYCLLFCYEANGQATETLQLRLFPNLPGVEFEGLVHEQVAYSLQRLSIRPQVCDVKITHTGYRDADALMQKIHRNIPLLEKQIQKTPERVNVRLHLVTHYNVLGEVEKAIVELKHLIKQTEEEDGYREAFLICCAMLGNGYRKINEPDTAIKTYRRALEVEPDYGLAHFLLGELYYKLGRIAEARMELLIAQNTGIQLCRMPLPRRAIYYYISYFLGRCHEEKGDLNLAIMEYKQAIAIEPLSAEVYTRLGNVYVQRGQYEEAQQAFNQATQFETSQRETSQRETSLATPKTRSSRACSAQETFNQAAQRETSLRRETSLATPGVARDKSRYSGARDKSRYSGARDKSRYSGARDKSRYSGSSRACSAPEESHKMPSVIALEQNYNQAANHCSLGIAYLYQGKLKEAERAFGEAINIDPQHAEAYSNLGLVHSKQGQFTEAEKNYLKALEIEPNRIEALSNLAYLYLRAGKVSEAEEHFLRASEIEPKAVDLHLALANIYAQRHQFESVQKQYDEIIYNCPEMEGGRRKTESGEQGKDHIAQLAEAFHCIGEQLVDRNKIAEAILAFQVAVAIEPSFVETLSGLAELYQHVNNYKEAIEMYEAVLRAEPKNYSAFYQLGECYLATGASQAARFCYLHALELNPDYHPALERMMNIEFTIQKEGRLT